MKTLLCQTPVEYYVEASGHGDHKLVEGLVGMTTSLRASRHIVKIVNAPEVKRHVPARFYERQIASSIFNFWKFDYAAVLDAHERPHSQFDAVQMHRG